jgi:hypothetical protein
MRLAQFPPGSPILREGEPVAELYLLITGTVSIVRGERGLAQLGPGAWLGEMAMLTGAVSSTTVLAETEVEALSVTQGEFLAAAEEDPTIFRQLAQMLAQRLRSTDRMLGEQQAARIVLLWCERAQTPLVEAVLKECHRWAAAPLLVLWNGSAAAGSTPAEHLANPSLLATLQRNVAAAIPVTIPTGEPADPRLDILSRFPCPLIVVAVSDPISPTTMPRVTETVSLTTTRARPHSPPGSWTCRTTPGRQALGSSGTGRTLIRISAAWRWARRLRRPLGVLAPGSCVRSTVAGTKAHRRRVAARGVDDIAIEVTGRAAMVPQLSPGKHVLELVSNTPCGVVSTVPLQRFEPTGRHCCRYGNRRRARADFRPARRLASMAVPGLPPVRMKAASSLMAGCVPLPAAACRLGAETPPWYESADRADRARAALMAESFTWRRYHATRR